MEQTHGPRKRIPAALPRRTYAARSFFVTAVLASTIPGVKCSENTYAPPPPPQVTVASPVEQSITISDEFTGRTAPIKSVEIRPRVSGYLTEVHFEEGTEVEAGELLYTIDQSTYQAALDAAKADLVNAKAQLEQAEYEFKRVQRLKVEGAAPEVELVNATAKRDTTQAAVMAAEAAVQSAELNLGFTEIAAPIAGRVNKTRAYEGALVGPSDPEPLTTIVPWHPIHVYFTVGERDVLAFRKRVAQEPDLQPEDFTVYLSLTDGTDYPLPGHIDYVDNRVDPDTGTIRVRAVFDNPEEILVPGIFTRVRIPDPPRPALLVPEVALQRDMAGYYLLTVNTDNVVERVNVEVGELVGPARVITAGLRPEARLIINGLQRARPGSPVNPQPGRFQPDIPQQPAREPAIGEPSTAPATNPSGDQ
jgi:RND family efflux transporter MFP subunit